MFLLYSGLGDTYGMGFEFTPQLHYPNDLSSLYEHPIQKLLGDAFRLHAGWFTDDTEMTLAVAEALLENDVKDLTPLVFADKFIELFKTQRRHGYSQGFYGVLNSSNSGQELLDNLKPNSKRNGAAMRSGPLGFLDISDILRISEMQAKITHNTVEGVLSSQIIALMYHYVIYNLGPKSGLPLFVRSYLRQSYSIRSDIHPSLYSDLIEGIQLGTKGETSLNGYEASLSVLDIFVNNDSMSEALLECVSRGGDTDTAGGLVMGLAYLSDEYENDIPVHLINMFKKSEPEMNRLLVDNKKLIHKFMKGKDCVENRRNRLQEMEEQQTD